jgi:enediyne biosynthesis thioesterase
VKHWELRHVVSLEESNAIGNVYYVSHFSWQGRCRELFLREHAPEVIEMLREDLSLVTLSASCRFLSELEPFEEIVIRMQLAELVQNRIRLSFEYARLRDGGEEIVARGEQEIAAMRRSGGKLEPTPIPAPLREALRPYEQG